MSKSETKSKSRGTWAATLDPPLGRYEHSVLAGCPHCVPTGFWTRNHVVEVTT